MLPQFTGESPFAAWLHRLAADVVLSGRDVNGTVGTVEEGGSARLDLSEAIGKLPPEARRIFVLHDVEGFKHEEMSEIFGITVGVSKAKLQRARVLLKDALGR